MPSASLITDYRQVGPLSPDASARALEEPAVKFGARFQPEAVNSLIEAADGYPYFIQEFGKAIWDFAPASPFSTEDATLAVATGRSQLDAGFFPIPMGAGHQKRTQLSAEHGRGR